MPDQSGYLFERPLLLLTIVCAVVVSCSDSGTGPDGGATTRTPTSLDVAGGDLQEGVAGAAIPDPLVVQVHDQNEDPVRGVSVSWAITTGDGSLSAASSTTDANGKASVRWTLGPPAGKQTVSASVSGISSKASFEALALAGEPARVVVSEDTVAFTAIGDTLDLSATVEDEFGNPVEGREVSWTTADSTIATIDSPGKIISQGAGSTEVIGRVGAAEGVAVVQVRQMGSVLTITAPEDTIAAGDTMVLAAELLDANGFAIEDASFSWSSSDTATATVDSVGRVLGKAAREATITATADDVSNSVTIRVVPGAPAALVRLGGDGQTGPAGEPLPDPVIVSITDAYDNAIPGEQVAWIAEAGHGSPSVASSTSDADGLARVEWTLGRHSGVDTIFATHEHLPEAPIDFTATATPNGTITGSISLSNGIQSASIGTGGTAVRDASEIDGARKKAGALPGMGKSQPSASSDKRLTAGPEFVPGSLIVRYRSEAVDAPSSGALAFRSPQTLARVASRLESRVSERARAIGFETRGLSPVILTARIEVEPSRVVEVQEQLRRDPSVLSVEREQILYRTDIVGERPVTDRAGATFPNDPAYPAQAWHYQMIDMPEAWVISTGSPNVTVAVVDDGIRFDHPDLTANLTDDGYDFVSYGQGTICGVDVSGDGDGYDPDPTLPHAFDPVTCDPSAAAGHGLHVAGTIGAVGDDGIGAAGVNWSVQVRPVRIFTIDGRTTDYDLAQGILYAAGLPADDGNGGTVQTTSPADIINLSLGGPDSELKQSTVTAALEAGTLIIAAAGNESTSLPSYPAAYPEVISVSAVGPDGQLASYSNYGSTIDLAAPGGDLADGDWTFGIGSTRWDFTTGQPTLDWIQGTSMAAPHVSGVAALLLAHDPTLSAEQLRARLLDYAVDRGAAGRDDQYGHGLLNARNSLTQSMGPTLATYARLYDAGTGQILETVQVDARGTYTFSALEDGQYYVYAGQDHDGDGLIGLAGRRWGAFTSTGTAAPTAVTVDGAGEYTASFSIGAAGELEPNDTPDQANVLPVGGYFLGLISGTSDADHFMVTVSTRGTYTFETSGWDGACGYAYEENTVLELYGSDGTSLIAGNDDVDASRFDYCSRITQTLEPGTYFLKVLGYYGLYYRLEAYERD